MKYFRKFDTNYFGFFLISVFYLFFCLNNTFSYDIKGIVTTNFGNYEYLFNSESFIHINELMKSAIIEPDGQFILQNIPEGTFNLTLIVPGFENRELKIVIPLEEELIIVLELQENELEPIIVIGKKEPWEANLENLLKSNPEDSSDNTDSYQEDMFTNNNSNNQQERAPGIPISSPIMMLLRWLRNNF